MEDEKLEIITKIAMGYLFPTAVKSAFTGSIQHSILNGHNPNKLLLILTV